MNLRLKGSKLVWSLAVLGSASAGLFMGLGNNAHSDSAKYTAMLAQHERLPGEVVVKLSPAGKMAMQMQQLNQVLDSRFQVASFNAFETNDSYYLVKLTSDAQTAQFLEASANNPAFEYAEPNYIVKALGMRDEAPAEVIPNDASFGMLWGMKNTGQTDAAGAVGTTGADIGATKAWATTTGNRDILVAIIDTGVDYTHPELVENIYKNPGESGDGKETNGIDDDANGFVDDFRGWNFAGVSTNDPMDDNEHGTHVAGTIGAKGNDGTGVAGVNWSTSILPIKFLTGAGSGSLADAVKAIQYATLMNAKVMNNSWGGGGFNQLMFDAIKAADAKGLLFVAAAGNDKQDADKYPHYPAGYQSPNVIAVAATTNQDTLATFSTYGKRTVHIAAPGHKIYSTIPGGYDNFSGTSMATPHVVGAAALLWGTNTSMTAAEVKDRLLRSRDFLPSIRTKVATGGRLNIYNAINGIYPPSPEPSEDQWRDVEMTAPIESAHPYENSARQEWTYEAPANVKFVRVVFSKIELENNYDYVKVIDGNGVENDLITGTSENFTSGYVMGNKMTIRFTSDGSNVKWGFAVAKFQVIYQ